MSLLRQDRSEFTVIFIPKEIDELGLTSEAFRIYAHLARRAHSSEPWASVESIAEHCMIEKDAVCAGLEQLVALDLVHTAIKSGSITGGRL